MPLRIRFTTTRVVSNKNSIIGQDHPNEVCSPHAGDVGWMKTPGMAPVQLLEHGSLEG